MIRPALETWTVLFINKIPSSHAGVLKELKVKLGDKINIGDLLALLDGVDTASAPAAAPASAAKTALNPAAAWPFPTGSRP